jgi:hypothetical protein
VAYLKTGGAVDCEADCLTHKGVLEVLVHAVHTQMPYSLGIMLPKLEVRVGDGTVIIDGAEIHVKVGLACFNGNRAA